MHGDGADRIVDAGPLDRQHADDRDHARDEADHDRCPGSDEARGGRDRDEGGEHPIQHHRDVRLAQDEPGCDGAADGTRRRSEVRRQGDVGEEADPVAGDKAIFDGQISKKAIKVLSSGLTRTPEDVTQIDPDVFAGFVDGLLDMYSRSNHQILHAHLTPVIEVSLVILERAGRPWPDDDPRLTPFKGYPAVGLRMPR